MILPLSFVVLELLLTLIAFVWLFDSWRRRRYRFSLGALLLATALIAYALFVTLYHAAPTFKQRWAIRQIESAGGAVVFQDRERDGRRVDLRNVSASNDVEALVVAQHLNRLPEVKTVFLSSGVSDTGLQAVCRADRSFRLEHLVLESMSITNAGLKHLADFEQLQSLHCDCTRIDHIRLTHLKRVRGLQSLCLVEHGFKIKKYLVAEPAFAEIGELEQLTSLELRFVGSSHLQISDDAARHLQRLKRLGTLRLNNCQISDAAAESLRAVLPECEIQFDPK